MLVLELGSARYGQVDIEITTHFYLDLGRLDAAHLDTDFYIHRGIQWHVRRIAGEERKSPGIQCQILRADFSFEVSGILVTLVKGGDDSFADGHAIELHMDVGVVVVNTNPLVGVANHYFIRDVGADGQRQCGETGYTDFLHVHLGSFRLEDKPSY